MPQRPKTRVREAILAAAAAAFADAGFERAALSDIVERAGTSIGNLYKHFGGKEALFAEFIPPGFTAELASRVRAQVQALRAERDAFLLEHDHPYWRASEALLAFAITHRERVVSCCCAPGERSMSRSRARSCGASSGWRSSTPARPTRPSRRPPPTSAH